LDAAAHGQLTVGEAAEHGAPCLVRQRVEHVIHVGQILNHVVENTGEPVNRQPFG